MPALAAELVRRRRRLTEPSLLMVVEMCGQVVPVPEAQESGPFWGLAAVR